MAWKSASGEDRNDIREVIPEFYYLPDFLTNSNMFVLGEWWRFDVEVNIIIV